MKTFKGIFISHTPEGDDKTRQQYTFNTDKEIKVGDHFTTKEYTKPIYVTTVLSKEYNLFNFKTKEIGYVSNLDKEHLPENCVLIKVIEDITPFTPSSSESGPVMESV